MYTFDDYKREILKLIDENGYDPVRVAKKSYMLFMHHQRDLDQRLYDILLDVANMDMGPEFELTEDEFRSYIMRCGIPPK